MQRERDAISPFICSTQESTKDTRTQDLPDNPAHVDESTEVGSEDDRRDLNGVGDAEGLENAERDANTEFSHEQDGLAGSEEQNKDGASCTEEGSKHGLAVAKLFRGYTVDEKTDDLTDAHGVGDAGLPLRMLAILISEDRGCLEHTMKLSAKVLISFRILMLTSTRKLVAPIRLQSPVPSLETRIGKERSHKDDIITFHNDCHREENRPADGLWVELDALPQSHLVLPLGSILGVFKDLGAIVGIDGSPALDSTAGLYVDCPSLFVKGGGHADWDEAGRSLGLLEKEIVVG